MSFSRSLKNRLTTHDLDRFDSDSLLDRIGRAVCRAGCLPRKELFETWETARRIRRLFRGGRIVDLAAGHGLLAQVLLVLDDSSPCALVVDPVLPPSAAALHASMLESWPRLEGQVSFLAAAIDAVELSPQDLVVSIHACGSLTDIVLERASAARARVAVLPCCHGAATGEAAALSGWIDDALAIDVARVNRLRGRDYAVRTAVIPPDITPKNRLLMGAPNDL